MHRHHAFLLPLAVLGGIPVAALAGPRSVVLPPDSFINQHVSTMLQMNRQVTLDPVVRRRLARHFHTSGPAVVRYIQDNLVLKKTVTAGRYQVYCISRTGHEYTIYPRLPVGTPVFVMRTTGKPILKLACGNPMTAELPPVVTKIRPYTSPEMASLSKPLPAPIAPGPAPSGPVLVARSSGTDLVITPAPMTRVGGILQKLPARSGRFPLGLLAGIPIIAGIAGHGGGSSSPVTPSGPVAPVVPVTLITLVTPVVPVTPTTPIIPVTPITPIVPVTPVVPITAVTPSPVPEPSTSAAFAVGAAGLAFLLAGTRRRKPAKN